MWRELLWCRFVSHKTLLLMWIFRRYIRETFVCYEILRLFFLHFVSLKKILSQVNQFKEKQKSFLKPSKTLQNKPEATNIFVWTILLIFHALFNIQSSHCLIFMFVKFKGDVNISWEVNISLSTTCQYSYLKMKQK
jgi:hypothetical protein